MHDSLSERGHTLEELFFRQRDAELVEKRKKLEQMEKNKEALAHVSGIKNPKVLDKLVELEVSPAILTSLTIVPLVEVAWADGNLDQKEREAILAEAAKHKAADNQLLEFWLKERPSSKFLEAWLHYIAGLKETMDPKEMESLKKELLHGANTVAKAAGGGFLGLERVSPEEKAVLKKMEEAF